MKSKISFFLFLLSLAPAFAQGTAFTYQGRLNDSGNPAAGIYDLRFTIFDSANAGSLIAGPLTNSATGITNGLFTVTLDFGAGVFPGAARWLEISVRTNGAGAFTLLAPRQPLTPSPYAITAGNVISGGLASGTYGNAVSLNNPANQFTGSFAGNGGNITNVNAVTLGGLASSNFWQTTGNTGTSPGANFIGTADNQPLEIKVNGQRALRLELNTTTNAAPNVIAGSSGNSVAPGVIGAMVGGGSTNGFGGVNSVAANYATIAGGARITIASNATYSAVVGGYNNSIGVAAFSSVLAGGSYNAVLASGAFMGSGQFNWIQPADLSAIVAGHDNIIETNADDSFIGGGEFNTVEVGALDATIGGGYNNAISALASDATIAGGQVNTNAGLNSTIGGGYQNLIVADGATIPGGEFNIASGTYSTVAGGYANTAAGQHSFAVGSDASANHKGAFVWNDASLGSFSSTADYQFLIHAFGGVGIGLNNPAAALHVASSSSNPEFQITQNNSSDFTRLRMNVGANQAWEMDVTPGATPALQFWNNTLRMSVDFNGNVSATSFNPTSDRNAKENFEPVNTQEVLDKVTALPLTKWNFKSDSTIEHIGPMAQDFYAAFHVGPDDKHIATVDADGVAFAAIQGLNQKVEVRSEKDEGRIQKLEAENAKLKQRLEAEVNRQDAENNQLKQQLNELKTLLKEITEKGDQP